jgi:hemolysin activation/secretion protein
LDLKALSKAAAGLFGAAGAVVALAAFMGSPAYAQQRPDAGSVLEQMKQPAIAPKPGTGDPLPRTPEPRPALGAPGLKVTVTAFRISGNTIYSEQVLLATIQEFVGKEQTIDGLNDAATKVRAYYRERGYFLSQAYLPQQEIKGGVVEIAVIEARVGKVAVNFKEGTRYSEGLVRGLVNAHLKEGELITEAGLERPLLLLNDFPNAVVTSEIKPSATIGAADLTVNISDSPGWVTGSVDIDNHGNRFTGQIRAGVSLSFNSPLGMGDQLSYRGFVTDDRMGFYRLAYVVPVGYWGTRVGLSYASFHYRLGKTLIENQVHGVGGVVTAYAFHPLIRTRSSNLIAQFAYETKQLNDRDDVQLVITDRKVNSAKIGAVGDFRDGLFGGGLNSYSFTITEGSVIIRQPTLLAGDQEGPIALRTAGRFHKKNFEFRRLQKITDNTTLLLSFQGQMASKNLTSSEKFSLGGPQGVRAYPVGEALGDTGYLFQGEMRYLLPGVKVGSYDVTVLGFYDQGWVRLCENYVAAACAVPVASNSNNRHLSGYGIGATIGKDSDFIFRANAAWQNENERPQSDTAQRVPRVWVQAIKWF